MENLQLTTIMKLDSLVILEEVMNSITQEQMDYLSKKLGPKKETETAIGTIHNELVKRLWVAAGLFRKRQNVAEAEADNATDEVSEKTAREEEHRCGEYAKMAQQMFWVQAHSDMGHWESSVGIREGWMIVAIPEGGKPEIPAVLKRILGVE